jgi:hypothetical protein
MIEVNISTIEEESENFLNHLTDNKKNELRKQMIKLLKESYWPDTLDYGLILEFINDFFVEITFDTEG